jgi:hypothetical protein
VLPLTSCHELVQRSTHIGHAPADHHAAGLARTACRKSMTGAACPQGLAEAHKESTDAWRFGNNKSCDVTVCSLHQSGVADQTDSQAFDLERLTGYDDQSLEVGVFCAQLDAVGAAPVAFDCHLVA